MNAKSISDMVTTAEGEIASGKLLNLPDEELASIVMKHSLLLSCGGRLTLGEAETHYSAKFGLYLIGTGNMSSYLLELTHWPKAGKSLDITQVDNWERFFSNYFKAAQEGNIIHLTRKPVKPLYLADAEGKTAVNKGVVTLRNKKEDGSLSVVVSLSNHPWYDFSRPLDNLFLRNGWATERQIRANVIDSINALYDASTIADQIIIFGLKNGAER